MDIGKNPCVCISFDLNDEEYIYDFSYCENWSPDFLLHSPVRVPVLGSVEDLNASLFGIQQLDRIDNYLHFLCYHFAYDVLDQLLVDGSDADAGVLWDQWSLHKFEVFLSKVSGVTEKIARNVKQIADAGKAFGMELDIADSITKHHFDTFFSPKPSILAWAIRLALGITRSLPLIPRDQVFLRFPDIGLASCFPRSNRGDSFSCRPLNPEMPVFLFRDYVENELRHGTWRDEFTKLESVLAPVPSKVYWEIASRRKSFLAEGIAEDVESELTWCIEDWGEDQRDRVHAIPGLFSFPGEVKVVGACSAIPPCFRGGEVCSLVKPVYDPSSRPD